MITLGCTHLLRVPSHGHQASHGQVHLVGRPQRTDGMEIGDIFESLVVSMAIYGHISQQNMALCGTVPPL